MTVNRLIKPMDIRQKIVAATTGLGWRVPHAAYVYEADLTRAVSFLRGLNEAGNNPKVMSFGVRKLHDFITS